MSINFDPTRVGTATPLSGIDSGSNDIQALKGSVSFVPDVKTAEASGSVSLPAPTRSIVDVDMSSFVGIPTPGADMLALLSELSDEQRRANREQVFAHFYYISGPHSYQQVAVDTIFKKECLDRVETREIVGIRPQRGNLFRQCPRADSQIVRLSGCIDVRENHMVCCG